MQQSSMRSIAQRLVTIRSEVLESHPFFGRLLLRIPFGFAECETAYTDMQKIVFDPSFVTKLDDTQLCFVLIHELMHCVLNHCTRGCGKIAYIYNVACDIVVNSIVLEAMQLKEIEVAGLKAMHLTPDGEEGRNYSAEEIYEKILNDANEEFIAKYGVSVFDCHKIWGELAGNSLLEEIWGVKIKKASKEAGTGSGIPSSIERHIADINHSPKISWKQVLHDYIQNDKCDYVYSKPDSRYQGEYIMPSFQENIEGSKIEKVFFFIDTSGSVSDTAIAESFSEIKNAIGQIGNMTGMVSFFDTQVSDPIAFESISDIEKIKPIGGGGTSFSSVFEHISEYQDEEIPEIIIIMTDGYAEFPDESVNRGIPVIWLIVDSEINSPWGECLHIYTDK